MSLATWRTERCDDLLCFHGTDRDFPIARPLTHFGTRAAAESAPRSNGILMAFRLTIGNALRVPDSSGGGDTWYWLRSAADQGVISEEEFLRWERSPTEEAAMTLLSSKGIDGLVYENDYEDPGSTSWVIFHGHQAVRVPVPSPEDIPETPMPR